MDELFGVSMTLIMAVLLAIFLPTLATVGILALRNRIFLKMALRNIPRRRAQTVLIIVGIMLSTVIMATAFGIGDTINFSIRNEAVKIFGPIDELILSARASEDDSFGSNPYFPLERFHQLSEELASLETIDGLAPAIGESVPAVNTRNFLSEGQMRVAGVDPSSLAGLGEFRATSGEVISLDRLNEDEVYINDRAAEELEAVAGDNLRLVVRGEPVSYKVKGIVDRGGLAGDQSTLILPLQRAQSLFGREGLINSIVVSNKGDETKGAELSDDVTDRLRVLFADPEIAADLLRLLGSQDVLAALGERLSSLNGGLESDLSDLIGQLERDQISDELIGLLSDDDVSDEVLTALEDQGLTEFARQADTLLSDLGEFRVLDVKQRALDEADRVASGVTTFFIILGLFSILVGVLLIFLIFVMLAAARRSEMGMARAVGAKRQHLVQMFVFEGTAYAVVSAAVGVLVGLGVGALIVVVVNQIIEPFEEDFKFTYHFEARSAIVAYCLGMVITLATVAFSAYRVSRMNIVVAIRGLPEVLATAIEPTLVTRVYGVARAVIRPGIFGFRAINNLVNARLGAALLNGVLILLWLIFFPVGFFVFGAEPVALALPISLLWIIDIFLALLRLAWPYILRGWLTFVLGILLTWTGIESEEAAPFRIGVALVIIGAGLMIRTVLRRTAMRAELRDRIAFSFIGVVMLVFWVLPFNTLRAVAGDLEGGPEMFFIAGVGMVAAAVWTVMYNSDLIVKALTAASSGAGRLRPVMVTAVAYPMSARFRTGLTLAMFALVIFTLIVVSILTEAFGATEDNVAIATGGWDIEGRLNATTPIGNIRHAIDESPDLRREDFAAIGGFTTVPIEARQKGAEEQRWQFYAARAADDAFLAATRHRLKLIADGYGPSEEQVWEALREDPTLAVVDALVVPSRDDFGGDGIPFQLEGLYYEDKTMSPIDIEVRDPRTGNVVPITVIGVMDVITDNFGNIGFGMFTSKANLDEVLPFPVPITNYRFRLADQADPAQVARALDLTFRENGLEAEVLKDLVDEQNAANRAFNNLFTGYMGMGLMVGIAALGVISLRAVVERRQQIGVLRAIGYRRRMIQLSFLLESSFVALLGIAIGVGLGTILSYNLVKDIQDDIETLRFRFPWLQIIIIVAVAYIFSLLTTFLPARQASRIYPAEALRYE